MTYRRRGPVSALLTLILVGYAVGLFYNAGGAAGKATVAAVAFAAYRYLRPRRRRAPAPTHPDGHAGGNAPAA